MEEYEPKVEVEGGPTPKEPIWTNMNLKLSTRGDLLLKDLVEYEPKVNFEGDLLLQEEYGT